MKLKHALLSVGVCAGSILSLHAQSSGAAGSASGNGSASATPGGATGGATSGASATTTAPSAINPATLATDVSPIGAPPAIQPVNPPLSVGAGTQSDLGPLAPAGSTSTASGLPNTTLPSTSIDTRTSIGAPAIDPIITSSGAPRRSSPGTAPIGPEPMTQPSTVSSQPASTRPIATGVTRGPLDNPTLSPTGRTSPATAATTPRDALGIPASVTVQSAPPPALAESVPTSPGASHTWVPGHYTLTNNQWSWTSGTWVVPPATGAVWVDGRYDATTQQWLAGHWEPGVNTRP